MHVAWFMLPTGQHSVLQLHRAYLGAGYDSSSSSDGRKDTG